MRVGIEPIPAAKLRVEVELNRIWKIGFDRGRIDGHIHLRRRDSSGIELQGRIKVFEARRVMRESEMINPKEQRGMSMIECVTAGGHTRRGGAECATPEEQDPQGE